MQSDAPVAIPVAPKTPWVFYGVLFGILGAISIIVWGPIGVSGTYPRFIGALFQVLDPSYAEANPYLKRMGSLFKPESFLVVGLLIGGFLGARLNREKAPKCEMAHPGETTKAKRYRDAFIGGFLIVFGARVAGGCTSGHIISGITQLSVSGFIFAIGVFATGILSAKMLSGRRAAGA
ncbi:MAG: YeeE/YedE family protein [Gemmatimonadetes bacterium]|nr:YeeE/YedE family protein [Gemmatimonadota bacterium]